MWKAFRKIEARDKLELVEMFAIPNQSVKYTKFLLERYEARLNYYDRIEDPKKYERPPLEEQLKTNPKLLDASSQQAGNLFIQAFNQKKRGG